MINVLLVEDNEKLNKAYKVVLEKQQFSVFSAFDGQEALDILEDTHVDIIITDVMMPNMDGYEFVSLLRQADYDQPILMITAKDQYEDKEKGFSLGVDDYMTKPIDVNEMILRVKAILKRMQIETEPIIKFLNTTVNQNSLTVTIKDEEILLPQKEFQLLFKLMSNANKIYTRQQLMDMIWGYDIDSGERTVDVHINRLRRRFIEAEDFDIITVRGLGYKVVINHEK